MPIFSREASGTATASAVSTMTDTGASWSSNQWTGCKVLMAGSWANVLSNTAAPLNVLTVDAWFPLGPITGTYVIGRDCAVRRK